MLKVPGSSLKLFLSWKFSAPFSKSISFKVPMSWLRILLLSEDKQWTVGATSANQGPRCGHKQKIMYNFLHMCNSVSSEMDSVNKTCHKHKWISSDKEWGDFFFKVHGKWNSNLSYFGARNAEMCALLLHKTQSLWTFLRTAWQGNHEQSYHNSSGGTKCWGSVD